MGIPVMDFTRTRKRQTRTGQRLRSDVESKQVWYPKEERFAEEVIEECAAFPHGE